MAYKTKGFQPDEIYKQAHDYLGTQLVTEGKNATVSAAAAEMAISLMTQQYVDKYIPQMAKTMSSYAKILNRMRKCMSFFHKKYVDTNMELLKTNIFINKLRDEGRITKEEIELYFKK